MKLTRLRAEGLKARDIDIRPGGVQIITGENGRGKSSALVALYLLVFGRTSAPDTQTSALDSGAKVAATGDGVLSLARGDSLKLTGEWADEGRRLKVIRTWRRSPKDGKVSEKIELSGFPVNDGGKAQKAAMVRGVLGPSAELFFPADLLALSPAKLRDRLLSAVPDSEITEAGIEASPDLRQSAAPTWLPDREEGDTSLAWLNRAHAVAAERLKADRAEQRQQEAALAELEDAWGEVESSDGLREKLAGYRTELAAIEADARAEADLARLREEVKAARGAPKVASAEAELVKAQAFLEDEQKDEADANRARQAFANISNEVMRLGAALAKLGWPDNPPEEGVTPEEYEERRAAIQPLEDEHRKRGEALSVAITRCDVLQGGVGLDRCPDCGADLNAALEEARALADEAKREAREALWDVERDLEGARASADSAERALQIAELRKDHEQALNDKASIETAFRLSQGSDVLGARRRVNEAQAALARAQVAAEGLEDLEMRLEFAEAEQGQRVGRRDRAAVERDIANTEEALEALGAYNARKAAREEAEEGVQICTDRVEATKAVVAQLDAARTRMMSSAAGWLERRLEAACGGREVRVVLTDERGNDTCRLEVGGVPVSALSGAETVRFLAGLVMVLAETSGAAWRPLLLDRFESVSKENREGFLASVVEAQVSGQVTQAILTGCPDWVPVVAGACQLRMGETPAEVAA